MNKMTKFQCETCNEIFDTEESATECERKGIEEMFTAERQLIKIKTEHGAFRTGRVLNIETKGHEKNYTIGIYPESNGLHFNYEYSFVLNGNKEAKERIPNGFKNSPLHHAD